MTRAYERLLRYAAIDTGSDETSAVTPSSPGQTVLAEKLAAELRELGVSDVYVDEHAYVYGRIPAAAGYESRCRVGFIAHLDTSTDACHGAAKPQVIENYDGGSIPLGSSGLKLTPESFPHLTTLKGKTLITTDGTTVLGADDKAGVAEIMTVAQTLLSDPSIPHGAVQIAFTPDEEVGNGVMHFDVDGFGADYAYTVDGGELGEMEYENFNAATAKLRIRGLSTHPGTAKGRMKNALLLAMEFQQMLPVFENPMYTEGYEGFTHLVSLSGTVEEAQAEYILRDHDLALLQQKKARMHKIAQYLNERYGEGTVELSIVDAYFNMKEQIEPHFHLIENAKRAMREIGVVPRVIPIRGGTDGARLSFMGLPCPNLCTGGLNFHSRLEFISVQAMEQVVALLLRIVQLYAQPGTDAAVDAKEK